jgi:hypothetical protein
MAEKKGSLHWLKVTRGSLAVLDLRVRQDGTHGADGKLRDWLDEAEVILDNIEQELRELADFEGMAI